MHVYIHYFFLIVAAGKLIPYITGILLFLTKNAYTNFVSPPKKLKKKITHPSEFSKKSYRQPKTQTPQTLFETNPFWRLAGIKNIREKKKVWKITKKK